MSKLQVNYCEPIVHERVLDWQHAYTFRGDRPMHWLQRLCCWILTKLGAFDVRSYKECTKVTRIELDLNELEALIDRQMTTAYEYSPREPPRELLLGPEQWRALVSGPPQLPTHTMKIVARNLQWHADGGVSYYHLLVRVVPWMDGVLVL